MRKNMGVQSLIWAEVSSLAFMKRIPIKSFHVNVFRTIPILAVLFSSRNYSTGTEGREAI